MGSGKLVYLGHTHPIISGFIQNWSFITQKSLTFKKQELKTIKTFYVIIRTLVTLTVKMPFVTKRTQSKYFFLISDTSQYFHLFLKIYCALAYLLGSKFEVHQIDTVLPNLVNV